MERLWELNAKELAIYTQKFYKERYEGNMNKRDISPIKLQKALYFLFAYWGQYIGKSKQKNSNSEVDFKGFSENLYAEAIQAWTYGPVLPEIYTLQKEGLLKSDIAENYLEDTDHNLVIKEFVDYLLPQIFDISDFGLVDLSHQDNCWKNHYNSQEEFHKNEIPKKEIIDEYCNK